MDGGRSLSYEEIVHHIVSDTPVPNVVEVPDVTLSESLRSVSEMAPRPKPWEAAIEDEEVASEAELAIEMGGPDELESTVSYESVSKYYAMGEELDEALNDEGESV